MIKALRWFGIEYLKTFSFCLGIALFVGSLMTLIAYPVQTIATILIGGAAIVLFMFITEWN